MTGLDLMLFPWCGACIPDPDITSAVEEKPDYVLWVFLDPV